MVFCLFTDRVWYYFLQHTSGVAATSTSKTEYFIIKYKNTRFGKCLYA